MRFSHLLSTEIQSKVVTGLLGKMGLDITMEWSEWLQLRDIFEFSIPENKYLVSQIRERKWSLLLLTMLCFSVSSRQCTTLEACDRIDNLFHESQNKVQKMRLRYNSHIHEHALCILSPSTQALPLKVTLSTHNVTGLEEIPGKMDFRAVQINC